VALSVDPPTLALPPPRAYRRLRVVTPAGLVVSALVVVGLEAAVLLSLEPLVRVFGDVTFRLVRLTGAVAWLGTDRFLGVDLFPLVFGSIPPSSYQAVVLWLAGSLAALVLVWNAEWIVAPLRFLLAYNLTLLSASALYLLFAGQLGYDAEAFSRLYLRTIVMIWLVTPLFMAVLGLTLPLTALERGGLLVLTLAYDVGFSAVRYAVFVWLLTQLGAVVMANLYLFFGPLLDIIYFVGIFAVFVRRLARRLSRGAPRFAW
jgi:hypothetical protein